jgi:hypothetical protein
MEAGIIPQKRSPDVYRKGRRKKLGEKKKKKRNVKKGMAENYSFCQNHSYYPGGGNQCREGIHKNHFVKLKKLVREGIKHQWNKKEKKVEK